MKSDQYKLHQLLGASILELLDGLCGALFLELLLVMPLAFFSRQLATMHRVQHWMT